MASLLSPSFALRRPGGPPEALPGWSGCNRDRASQRRPRRPDLDRDRILAAVALAAEDAAAAPTATATATAKRRAAARAMRRVGEQLGITAPVARASYVDPRVLARYEAGTTIDLDGVDRAVIELVEEE